MKKYILILSLFFGASLLSLTMFLIGCNSDYAIIPVNSDSYVAYGIDSFKGHRDSIISFDSLRYNQIDIITDVDMQAISKNDELRKLSNTAYALQSGPSHYKLADRIIDIKVIPFKNYNQSILANEDCSDKCKWITTDVIVHSSPAAWKSKEDWLSGFSNPNFTNDFETIDFQIRAKFTEAPDDIILQQQFVVELTLESGSVFKDTTNAINIFP